MTAQQTLNTLCALAILTRARQSMARTAARISFELDGDAASAQASAILWASKLNMIRDQDVAGACALHFAEQPWGSRMFFGLKAR